MRYRPVLGKHVPPAILIVRRFLSESPMSSEGGAAVDGGGVCACCVRRGMSLLHCAGVRKDSEERQNTYGGLNKPTLRA